jgi:flavin-dependent dehydrogenase
MRRAEKTAMTVAPSTADHLVIGGGPAGSMAAIRLAAAGRDVVLIERERAARHKVCGEFLSREAAHYLHQLGIDLRNLGAESIRTLRLSSGNAVVTEQLPFQAMSLSRRALDETLLQHARQAGCTVLRGDSVESLTLSGNLWTAALANGEAIRAQTVFLATGKHDVRGFHRSPCRQSDLIGFKLHWQLAPAAIHALSGFMDLFFFPGGYGGLSLVENGAANLCLVVRRSVLRKLGDWPTLFAAIRAGNPHLDQLLNGAQPLWPRPLAISPIPYGYLGPHPRGLWCVGDQAAVIPSFTGDGVSIALHSAALAAEMCLAGNSPADYESALRAQLRRSMSLATWISRAAVTNFGRVLAPRALALFPAAIETIARVTRIPQAALVDGVEVGISARPHAKI